MKRIKTLLGATTLWVSSLITTYLWYEKKIEQTEKIEMVEKIKDETKINVCDVIDCKEINSKDELFKLLEEVKTEYPAIKNLVNIVKNKINSEENLYQDDIDYYIQTIDEIKKLNKVYEIYLKEKLTSNTNIYLNKFFTETLVNSLKNGNVINWLSEKILEFIIKKDFQILQDTFIWKTTVRDFVEKNIEFDFFKNDSIVPSFKSKNYENEETEKFLNILTIEYINEIWRNNFIDEYKAWDAEVNLKEINFEDLNLDLENLENMLKRVREKWNFKNVNFSFSLKSKWETYKFDFSKLWENLEEYKKLEHKEIYFSNDPIIKEIQKTHWIVHKNKTERNEKWEITYWVQRDRVDPYILTPKWQLFPRYLTDEEALKDKEKWLLIDTQKHKSKYFNLDSTLLNHPTKTLTSPETLEIVEEISKTFYKATRKKLTINSLLRTKPVNDALWNSSENSSHMYASALDFRIKNLNNEEKEILKNILKEYDKNNLIVFIDESAWKFPHYHAGVTKVSQTMNIKFENYSKIQKKFDKNISTSEYLNTKKIDNWLDLTTKIILQDIFAKAQIDYMSFSVEQRVKFQENLITFIKYITFIESSGWKYKDSKKSTAKWPFQIINYYEDWVRIYWNPKKWGFSTFETWWRTYTKYVNNVEIPEKWLSQTPEFVEKILDYDGKISPNDLTQEQNINLFLVWQFLQDWNKNAESLMKIILLWDTDELRKFYFAEHHTNPDKDTIILEEKAGKIFYKKFKKVI